MTAYIDLLKATRAEIVHLLKRRSTLSVDALADELSISKVAVRRHLDQLEDQGFVRHDSERCDRGRPRFVYSLTTEGNGLFPDTSADFACALLGQVSRTFGGKAVDSLLADQASDLIQSLQTDVANLGFDDRVLAVAKQFNERGYETECRRLDDGSYQIIEHNCPIREVAERFPQVCHEELRVYSEVTGGTVALACRSIATGGVACEYRIVPDLESTRRQLPVMQNIPGGNDVSDGVTPLAGERVVCSRKHQLAVCVNVHCSMNGADELVEHLVMHHGLAPDVPVESGVALELTYCFGACDLGPNVELDGHFYDSVTTGQIDDLLANLD